MNKVELNKQAKLSQHFTLGEMTKTSAKTADGNIPSHEHIENLKRVCRWLERLRDVYNRKYSCGTVLQCCKQHSWDSPEGGGVIINSGYRSPAVNKAVGGVPSSNHLTGCAVDIHVIGIEQLIRYAAILLDISDEWKEDFDELLLERKGNSIWLHFAVRPFANRRKVKLLAVSS